MAQSHRQALQIEAPAFQWRRLAALGLAMAFGAALSSLASRHDGQAARHNHGAAAPSGWDALASWGGTPQGKPNPARPLSAAPTDDGPLTARSSRQIYDDFLQASRKPDPVEAAITAVQTDPAFRSELLKEYFKGLPLERNLKTRFVLAEALNDDIVAQTMDHARRGGPAEKVRAVELLASMKDGKPAARDFLMKALREDESDARTLSRIVSSVRPRELADPREAQPIVERLQQLRQHSDAEVRNAALTALGEWAGGAAIESEVITNLQTGDAATVGISVQAANQGQLRTPAYKSALLAASARGELPADLRRFTLNSLMGFKLSPAEYEQVMQAQAALGKGG